MQRKVVIDTETTGLTKDDRIIEIACVELVDGKRTGYIYHAWFNPERESHPKALEVHGLTSAWLADKPLFEDMAEGLQDFLYAGQPQWIIHNAAFDARMMQQEFGRIGGCMPTFDGQIFCTLQYGRKKHTLEKNTLNKLCELYGVDTSGRVVHGALTDAELLTSLYLKMMEKETC